MKRNAYRYAALKHICGCKTLLNTRFSDENCKRYLEKLQDLSEKMRKFIQSYMLPELYAKELTPLANELNNLKKACKTADDKTADLVNCVESVIPCLNSTVEKVKGDTAIFKNGMSIYKEFLEMQAEWRDVLLELYYLIGYAMECCVIYVLYGCDKWCQKDDVSEFNYDFIRTTGCDYYKNRDWKKMKDPLDKELNEISAKKEELEKQLKLIFREKNVCPYVFSIKLPKKEIFLTLKKNADELHRLLEKKASVEDKKQKIDECAGPRLRKIAVEAHNYKKIIDSYLKDFLLKAKKKKMPFLSDAVDAECEELFGCWKPALRYCSGDSWYLALNKENGKKLCDLLNYSNLKKMVDITNDVYKKILQIQN